MKKFEYVDDPLSPGQLTWKQTGYREGTLSDLSDYLLNFCVDKYTDRTGSYFQVINPATQGNKFLSSLGYGYEFNKCVPDRLPICRAHAIAEPLKVRMITKNEVDTYILKPVQMSLWKTL